jgi:hypothetical protein
MSHYVLDFYKDLLIGKVVIRNRRRNGAADILLAELTLLARNALTIALTAIDTRHGLEALGERPRKSAAEPGQQRHGQ